MSKNNKMVAIIILVAVTIGFFVWYYMPKKENPQNEYEKEHTCLEWRGNNCVYRGI